ncbi:hypothetical protein Peur_021437 [Populus x canadensis]
MTKSKTKTSSFKTTQGDFSLQVPCHGSASRLPRALSRSRSPIHHGVTSPSSTPRRKPILADFVSPSSEVRVSSKRRNKFKQRNPSASPSACTEGSSKNPRSHFAPTEGLAGFHHGSPQSGPGNPTRGSSPVLSSPLHSGHACSSSTPPSGGPSTDARSRAPATPSSAAHSGPASVVPPGTSIPSPPPLVHFPDIAQSVSCHLNEVDLGEAMPMLRYCLIGYVAGKYPGYASLLQFISKHWPHAARFTMHDSGWLIFAFTSELAMLETLSAGPYFVFGRPLILKIMPEFFDFQANDMTKLPTWVKLPNLPLRCWTPLCLSKIGSMIGKPIHCDIPTATMSRLSYARILVEVDLLQELPNAIQVVLPNGTPLSQQVIYESLPKFCKRCRVIGHSANTCNRGSMQKKRSHTAAVSEDAEDVGKQQSASDVPPAQPSTADVVDPVIGHSGSKRSKIIVTGSKQKLDNTCTAEAEATPVVMPPALKKTAVAVDSQRSKQVVSGATPSSTEEESAPPAVTTRRQYLTRSRVVVTSDGIPVEKHKPKGPAIVLSMSGSGTPS